MSKPEAEVGDKEQHLEGFCSEVMADTRNFCSEIPGVVSGETSIYIFDNRHVCQAYAFP